MNWADRFLRLDRRFVFLFIAVAILIPVIAPFKVPGQKVSDSVRSMFEAIDTLPPGSPVLISMDYDPASAPELQPMSVAILRHAFKKNLRVVAMTLWQTGTGLAQSTVEELAKAAGKQDGKDYVFLGWKAGTYNVIIAMAEDVYRMYPADARGRDARSLPVMAGIKRLKDFSLIVTMSAGTPGVKDWIQYGVTPHKLTVAAGATGVITPEAQNYLQARQIVGLVGGMKGALEFEIAADLPGKASGAAAALSTAHFTIIFLIILCNILYFARGRGEGKA